MIPISTMTTHREMVSRFLDGELSTEEADTFRNHLADCAECQRELHELMQLEALGMALAETQPVVERTGAKVIWLSERRRWRARAVTVAASIATLAAAAALVLWYVRPQDSAPRLAQVPELPGLGPTRAIEGRLSYAGADRYRPYNVQRAQTAPEAEKIRHAALAHMEESGDLHGMAAAHMLMGSYTLAGAYLDRAQQAGELSDDEESDRALLVLMERDPKAALDILDSVLTRSPRHPQALWNQGLALEKLGLLHTAKQSFERVAELGEPGWHEEARQRADELRVKVDERKAELKQAERAGQRLIQTGQATDEELRAYPGLMRLHFYDAVRTAPSRERIDALRSTAEILDQHYGDATLTRYLDRVARADFAVRGPFARAYADVLASQGPADGARALIAEIRGARQVEARDILMGAMSFTDAQGRAVAKDFTAEFRALAAEANDPSLVMLAADYQARQLMMDGKYADAVPLLEDALSGCALSPGAPSPVDHMCVRLEIRMGSVLLGLHRMALAGQYLESGLARARRTKDWNAEDRLLRWLAELEWRQDDTGVGSIARARAYLDEFTMRNPVCSDRFRRHELLALMHINRNQLDQARDEMSGSALLVASGLCKEPPFDLQRGLVLAPLLSSGTDAEIADLRARLADFRSEPDRQPGDLAYADYIEGRLLIERDRDAARDYLQRAIARASEQPPDDVTARKARAYSFIELILDAGARHELDRALALLGEEIGVEVADRCVVGIAGDHHMLVVARGPTGASVAEHWPRGSSWMPADKVVPDTIRRAVAGCEVVDVLARAPYFGAARLFPPEVAWRFRIKHARPGAPPLEPRRVVVTDVEPPSELGLPALRSSVVDGKATVLRGATATPSRVLSEIARATEIEIHAHGLINARVSDTSFLALSPDASGRHALTADDIRAQRLAGQPLVILGACQAAQTAAYFHAPGSLASAFADAGAGTVIASPAPISDAEAGAFFNALRKRIASGQPAAIALRNERLHYLDTSQRDMDTSQRAWTEQMIVFE